MKKIGIVFVIVIVFAAIFFVLSEKTFHDRFLKRAEEIAVLSGPRKAKVITDDDLKQLPMPVRRYMEFSGVKGKKPAMFANLKHGGEFKPGIDSPWMKVKGEYQITGHVPSFIWYGKVNALPLISIAAVDEYFLGKGRMNVRFMSVFNIADASGQMTDMSAFGRLIAELSMNPSAFLDSERAVWKAADDKSAVLRYNDSGLTQEAEFYFNDDGSLNLVRVNRYYGDGEKGTLEVFEGKASEPKDFGGYVIPSYFIGTWKLKTGDYEYVRFRIESAEFI